MKKVFCALLAALTLLDQRREGLHVVGLFFRRWGRGGTAAAAHRLGGAQADVPAGTGDGIGGGMPPLPRQHPLAARLAFLIRFAHEWGSPSFAYGNTAQFPPNGLSTAPAAAARHLRCQNAR